MAQSAVDVCNSALQKLGAVSILSLDDNSREARQCALSYDWKRRSELRNHRWNFATKRVALAPDSAAPISDFTYQFTMPADCLRILRTNDPLQDWVIEGRKILTNVDNPLYLRYIADITDVTQWDAAFYDAMAAALAIDMCEALTNSASKLDRLDRMYKDAIGEARKNNAFESGPVEPPTDSWILARF